MKNMIRHAAVLLFLAGNLFSQPKQNIYLFYSLCDSIVRDSPEASYNLYLPGDYIVFRTRLESGLSHESGRFQNANTASSINITIDNARTEYTDSYREGLFGDYKVVRKISLSGSRLFKPAADAADKIRHFSYCIQDTINYSSVKDAENPSLPFTKGTLPPEPFFSSLVEPVLAISGAAAAAILFFTVRSK
jgi:hypothetical protein